MTFPIRFDNERTAAAIRVAPQYPPADALAALDLPSYNGIVVVHGGAAGIDPGQLDAVRRFLVVSLAGLAERRRLLIADGGTQVGVPRVMGEARREVSGTFPLVGVLPYKFGLYPGRAKTDPDQTPLDPFHSHFILVDGERFGDESALLVGLLRASGKPGVALIINGGEIVSKEAQSHAVLGNTLITVRGSGRVADELADPRSERRALLPPHARLEVASLNAPGAFTALLDRLLTQAATHIS